MSQPLPFGERVAAAVRDRGPLCVGLDPSLDRIPSLFSAGDPAATVEAFLAAVIARLAGRAAVVKPQIAHFERLGPGGLAALARITERARAAGLIVLLDAKRGDIASTADAYVDAYLGPDAWLHADAVTVNPYMGWDTIAPWLGPRARPGTGVAALVRTSNPGAQDLQDRAMDGAPLWLRTAELIAAHDPTPLDAPWSSVMAVVGATAPEEARRIRAILPRTIFLVPGYGAQGAGAAEALAGAVAGTNGPEGVLVNASRAALYPTTAADAATMAAWAAAFDANLRDLRTALRDAMPAGQLQDGRP